MIMSTVAFALGGYLLGSIPFGLILGRLLKGVDIREYGSGKTGMTNSLRTLGLGPALAVLLADILKGALLVIIARLVTGDARIHVVAALAAIAGHDWPVYAGFRGGRGVSTTTGATLALMPPVGLLLPIVGGLLLWRFRYVSLMSVAGAAFGMVLVIALAYDERVPGAYAVFAVVAGSLIIILHRDNISRLLAGTEPKLGQGGSRRPPPKKYAASGGRPH